jgi:serine/threonine-protein kinase
VLDFCIAKASESNHAVSSATKTGAVMGSPSYMSPEQMVGAKGIDRRTDLWALGVVAFECLTGQLPFEAETIGGLAIAVCSGPMPVPSRINPALSEEVDQWFARSCAREPTQRFHSAKDMAEALHLLATGQRSSDPRFSRDPRATSSSPVASTELAGPLSPPPAMVPTLSSALPAKTTPALGATTGAPLSAGSEEEVLLPMQRGKGTVVAMAAVVLLAAVTAVGVVLANHSPAVPSAASAEGSAAPAPSVPPGSGFSAGPAAAAPAKSESATPASDPLPSPRSVPGPSTTPGVPNAEKASVAGLPTPTTVRSASPAATMRSPTLPPAAAPPVRDLAPPPAPVTNCNPPTWTDESGHVHLKRGCQ